MPRWKEPPVLPWMCAAWMQIKITSSSPGSSQLWTEETPSWAILSTGQLGFFSAIIEGISFSNKLSHPNCVSVSLQV